MTERDQPSTGRPAAEAGRPVVLQILPRLVTGGAERGAVDIPVTLAEAWLIETVAQLVRVGTFFIPASLGATEVAMVLLYEALVGAPSLGFAVALIRRARELLWIAWGLWLGWLEAPGAMAAAQASTVTSDIKER